MRYALLCALAIVVVLAAGCTSAESVAMPGYNFSSIDKVAVVEVMGSFSEPTREQVVDYFTMELMRKRYQPIERSRVQTVLAEQRFQHSEHVTDEQAAQLGRILNVPAVIIVTMPELKESMTITAKMVEVETGRIVWTGSGSGTTGKTVATVGGAAAGAGLGVWAGGDRTGRVVGGVVGGALGGLAGYSLTPQQLTQAQRIIKKVCRELPAR